jgi:two-component system, chemotaxis family, chemotaxis protein CheY
MKKVLIVDDSPTIRRMIKASLHGLGDVVFDEAGSGLEAIERLALGPVSLMILDLNMPDMNGKEVIEFMRAQKAYAVLPIIVLTTRQDEPIRKAVLTAGASVYMTKPFEPAEIAEQVQRLLK